MMWPSSAPGRRAWPRPSTPRPRACRRLSSTVGPSAARRARRRGSRTTLGFPTGITGAGPDGACLQPGAKVRRRDGDPRRGRRLQAPATADAGRFRLTLANAEQVRSRSVVIASGARYRRLDVRKSRVVRGLVSPLLGIAAGGPAVRRPGSGAGRRRQLRRSGGRLSGQPGREGLDDRPRPQPRCEHVALSGRPHRREPEHRSPAQTRR